MSEEEGRGKLFGDPSKHLSAYTTAGLMLDKMMRSPRVRLMEAPVPVVAILRGMNRKSMPAHRHPQSVSCMRKSTSTYYVGRTMIMLIYSRHHPVLSVYPQDVGDP